ncbi:LPS-assembly protein LptD [Thalassotalea insulae]|uniref:LPS-assembly protein LptD n=1 Tax=Thalassotalea insulae TaxID=2056778 RepID=A0ABQ6GX91_9GAMM|nr:LPS assembly protein LptD [Thalassotalea insulae]GLX79135.1 LPS-assembly protein LptD [Thalassotalea insulae]
MPFFRTSLLLFIGTLTSYQVTAQSSVPATNTPVICPVPSYSKIQPDKGLIDVNAINIWSNESVIEKGQFAKFSGGVTLLKKDHTVVADEIEINQLTSFVNAQGNIHFQNQGVDIFASQLKASKELRATVLTDSAYQLANNPGHGQAGTIAVTANGTLSLVDSSFTTCYGEVPDWQLQASEINISMTENHGEAYNARFKLFGVPVLYIPYFSFPVNNERKSGFLYPKLSTSSRSGLTVELPFYWNIAPNMDATLTPRYMSKRGVQLLSEFRYLSGLQQGAINIEYLNKDDELKNSNDARYLARLQHIGTFSDNFRAYVDYTTISDDNYLVDINSEQYNSNDAYLYQIAELAYFKENWQAKILLQDFEVLGNHQTSYKTLPHIEFKSFQPLSFLNGRFDIYSEITRFQSDNLALPEADRYHIEAGTIFPYSTPAWFFNSEFKLLQTNYYQKRIANHSQLEKNVSRTLPKIRFHGGVNFDRPMRFGKRDYTQTLEPQLQYLYIPDEEQNNIALYDTTSLQDDYNGLFRDKRFSGLDRIAQANQYSWGLTSRILNPLSEEVFRMSVGRIVYLNNSNSPLNNEQSINTDESALATEVFMQINRHWQFSGDIQYNTKNNSTNKSQSTLDYLFDKNRSIQLNHRYTRNVSGTSLEQVSLLANLAINKDWQFVGRLTQDLQKKRSLESYVGLQYQSCCWAIRFAYHRHINSNLDEQNFNSENRDEFDSGFMIQFVIKGLGGEQKPVTTDEMFNSSIFGYKRPYFLNN